MTIDKIKVLLGLTEDDSQDNILVILLTNAMNTINVYLGVQQLPSELEFVAEQLAVIKFNKLGSEGISTEKIDVLSTTYMPNELSPFKTILDAYKDNNNIVPANRRVKFL